MRAPYSFSIARPLIALLIATGALAYLSSPVGYQSAKDAAHHNTKASHTERAPSTKKEQLFVKRGPFQEQGRQVWEYEIVINEQEHKLANGTLYKVWAYGGSIPAPTLIAREGDLVRIRLINNTSASHTIHSHGLFVPQRMDGVPPAHGMTGHDMPGHEMADASDSLQPVKPGEEFTYEYIARPAGTHFYHCHVNTNEHLNRGMAGALIVLPRVPEPHVDQDIALVMQEWNSRYAQGGQLGNPREVNDCDFFTLNGKSFPETEPIRAKLGEVLRIRFINAGSQPHFMHLHGHEFMVTHKDGVPLAEPQLMDTVAVGPGERVDIIILANNPGEWPLHCHTAAHQTNAGAYPGGMMTHLLVGDVSSPATGDGPLIPGVERLREVWRRSALSRLRGMKL
jgi:FtsP/CotA-like multicopper oxidase with cupredoxin domain